MTLAFLTPTGAPPESPLARVAARDGATLGLGDGWLVPVRFTTEEIESRACREAVGWADASALGKLELRGPLDARPGIAARKDGAWWCPIARNCTLVIASPDRDAPIRARLAGSALDVTTQFGGLVLAGPAARETIARFCALDLRPKVTPPGGFRPGSVARTPGYVLCEAPDRYLLLFGAALAQYIWTVVSDAGGRLGGQPVASDVLPALDPLLEEAAQHA